MPALPQRQGGHQAARRRDNRADAGIGGADQRQALFDGPRAGVRQVLEWTGVGAKPGIVGNLAQQIRAGADPRICGENDLVADQWQGLTQWAQINQLRAAAGG